MALTLKNVSDEVKAIDTSSYKECQRVFANCMAIPAFADSHPLKQPGAPA